MVIDKDWNKIDPIQEQLVEKGLGYSCFDLAESAEIFQKVLNDWVKTAK